MPFEPELSVVIPVYNEEESVEPLYDRVSAACRGLDRSYEIVFVDDGSSDRTFELLAALHERDPAVMVLRCRRNYGQTAAMAAGFRHARGRVICSMDGDLQNDPVDIPRLLAKIDEGYDVVCGWRKDRQDKFWSRRLPSVIANWIIGRITGVRIHDNGCSLKAYRAEIIKKVSLYSEMHRFIPAMTTLTGARIAEIVVTHHARRFGESKYGIGRVWRVVLDIFVVKMITGFAARPRMWFGLLSIPVFAASLATFALGFGMFLGHMVEQWLVVATVAMLSLFLGAHLISLAVIAELAVRAGGRSPVHAVPREQTATETNR